jgi:5-methylcytosine-specific restriction enzyme A
VTNDNRPWWVSKRQNKQVLKRTKEGLYAHRQKHQKFYQSKEWQSLRLYKLSINPLCEICLKKGLTEPANEVDHIDSLRDNYSLRSLIDNLQSLCKSDHSKKTIQEGTDRRKKEQEENIIDNMSELDDF